MIEEEQTEDDDLQPGEEVAETPSVSSDPFDLVKDALPEIVLKKFRVASYRKAASILKYGMPHEFAEIVEALEAFEITTEMIRKPGGNESEIPKTISKLLRHKGWHETTISGNLHIVRTWREVVGESGKGSRSPKRNPIPTYVKNISMVTRLTT